MNISTKVKWLMLPQTPRNRTHPRSWMLAGLCNGITVFTRYDNRTIYSQKKATLYTPSIPVYHHFIVHVREDTICLAKQ